MVSEEERLAQQQAQACDRQARVPLGSATLSDARNVRKPIPMHVSTGSRSGMSAHLHEVQISYHDVAAELAAWAHATASGDSLEGLTDVEVVK